MHLRQYSAYIQQRFSELLGMTYNSQAVYTLTDKQLLIQRTGICFDFVNYLFRKDKRKGHCYFIWFNALHGPTHTIYIDPQGYRLEATPENNGMPLEYIYVERKPVNKIVQQLVTQVTGGIAYDSENPLFYCCEYTPENLCMTIEEFIDRRFVQIEQQ
jgi:hypothetical protein